MVRSYENWRRSASAQYHDPSPPYDGGFPLGIVPSQFVIIEFGTDGEPASPRNHRGLHRRWMSSDIYLEKRTDIDRYDQLTTSFSRRRWTMTSRNLLRQVAREYERWMLI